MTISRTTRTLGWGQRIAAFVAALLLATVWGSVVQTQFNLQALAALDVDVPLRVRALTTLQDLVGFGPAYAGIVLAAWLPAFLVAALLVRVWPKARVPLYALAAGVGLIAAVRAVDAVAPMPVLIDATRGIGGLLAMAAGSLLAGAAFAWWTRTRRSRY
ncbi:hypothetical protein [Luteimonas sp. 3794]|uniref:hypothetical protein n=1 Tax=Luteimonas sp. 3794 TaxID=2817730 RepID=UPI002854E5D9|nr:hypothetical protein [Luteimonas sp. 3794]MDR6992933.1 hypothetical protein [Luteimonas sp. 3794]